MHAISVDTARILRVETLDDIARLYTYGGYWVNYEYFDINIRDTVTGKVYASNGRLKLSWPRLLKRPTQTLRDILLQNGIIAEDADVARKSTFYAGLSDEELERFKFPDWGRIAAAHAGVWFEFSRDSPCAKYFWYQSLDASSGCVWDVTALTALTT